jgi:Tfp pilus assembly protein PilW
MFGFLPYEMIGWTCIDDQASDAYMAINAFYRKAFGNNVQEDLSLVDADKHFKAAVKYIASNMNWNATAAIVKNTLSELHRDADETVDRRDILFLFPHRNRTMNHLYRWKMDKAGEAMLQVLLISRENKVARSSNIFKSQSGTSGSTSGDIHAGFTGCGIYPGGVKYASKYRMSEEYMRYFEG